MSPSQPTAALAGRWSALASAHGAAVGRRRLNTALATRVPVRVQTHTRTGAHARARARAHIRTHTHTRARTHTRTHTHTHTCTRRATHNDTRIAPDGAPNIDGCYCAEYKHGALIEPPSHRRSNRPLQLLPLLRTSTPQQPFGKNRKVCLKLLARAGYCALHACHSLCAGPYHRLLCGAAFRRCRCTDLSVRGRAGPAMDSRCPCCDPWPRVHS